MESYKKEIVENLSNGRVIVKIQNGHVYSYNQKPVVKYTIAGEKEIVNILDSEGNLTGIQFFDNYQVDKYGNIIIGVQKNGKEYSQILAHFNLSETQGKYVRVPSGFFEIGPYAKERYDYIPPTRKVEDIVPEYLQYNYGVINSEGILSIYPNNDYAELGGEGTCIVGRLDSFDELLYGYKDLQSGKDLSPICFEEAGCFNEGRAAVKYRKRSSHSSYYGYLDRNKVMTNPENNEEYADGLFPHYHFAFPFQDGIAKVTIAQFSHFAPTLKMEIDLNGNIIHSYHNQSAYSLTRRNTKNPKNPKT